MYVIAPPQAAHAPMQQPRSMQCPVSMTMQQPRSLQCPVPFVHSGYSTQRLQQLPPQHLQQRQQPAQSVGIRQSNVLGTSQSARALNSNPVAIRGGSAYSGYAPVQQCAVMSSQRRPSVYAVYPHQVQEGTQPVHSSEVQLRTAGGVVAPSPCSAPGVGVATAVASAAPTSQPPAAGKPVRRVQISAAPPQQHEVPKMYMENKTGRKYTVHSPAQVEFAGAKMPEKYFELVESMHDQGNWVAKSNRSAPRKTAAADMEVENIWD